MKWLEQRAGGPWKLAGWLVVASILAGVAGLAEWVVDAPAALLGKLAPPCRQLQPVAAPRPPASQHQFTVFPLTNVHATVGGDAGAAPVLIAAYDFANVKHAPSSLVAMLPPAQP